jgi:hypothetical protein
MYQVVIVTVSECSRSAKRFRQRNVSFARIHAEKRFPSNLSLQVLKVRLWRTSGELAIERTQLQRPMCAAFLLNRHRNLKGPITIRRGVGRKALAETSRPGEKVNYSRLETHV